jgi:hypothetical protein
MVIKSKAKKSSHKAAMLFFYILQNITLTNAEPFRMVSYLISFQDPKLYGSSVAFNSQVCDSVIFLLPILENYKITNVCALQCLNLNTRYHECRISGSSTIREHGNLVSLLS